MNRQVNGIMSLIRRTSGCVEDNPRDTLNMDAAKQLYANPSGVIAAYETLGLRWDTVFNQIKQWSETVSVENKMALVNILYRVSTLV